MKISVSMIVKNEEQLLATALETVKDADEIIIVDTGSTDRTVEIARQYTDKVYVGEQYLWRDDFAFSRNQSLSLCTGDWILIIDADEELEPGGVQKLREEIPKAGNHKTISFRVINKAKNEVHIAQRAFKRCPEVFWKGAIHNYLCISETHPCEITLWYGYSPAHKADPDRALRILQNEVKKNPTVKREAYYLAREYWYRKDYNKAIEGFTDYLMRADWAPEMADAWLYLARCHWMLNQGEKAREACLKAIMINTQFKEAFLFMADTAGPKNRLRWLEFAETATNENVLFVRTPRSHKNETNDPSFVYRPHKEQFAGQFSSGAGCIFEEGVRLDCTGNVTIGAHCMLLRNVKIHTHHHAFFDGCVPDVTKEQRVTPIDLVIGDNVVIAEDAVILPSVSYIGHHAVIGNSAVVTHDVPDGEIWAGNPARKIGSRSV